jgi:outer membrane receptor for Fe3+-dicitrate
MDGSNVPYVPDHRLAVGFDYNYSKFSFGMNMTYQSESYGTAAETETEVHEGTANARAGRIDSYALGNFYAGYELTDNAKIKFGVNNFTDLEYIATRHPQGARAGAPLTAYVNASIRY